MKERRSQKERYPESWRELPRIRAQPEILQHRAFKASLLGLEIDQVGTPWLCPSHSLMLLLQNPCRKKKLNHLIMSSLSKVAQSGTMTKTSGLALNFSTRDQTIDRIPT